MGVIERLDAQMIATAKQTFSRTIPDPEGEVAQQVVDTVLSPGEIGAQKELDIGRGPETVLGLIFQFGDQVRARIQTSVGDNPNCSVQAEGLVLSFRLCRGLQKRMTESNRAIHPDLLRIRTAKSQEVRQILQRVAFDWTLIQVHNADDAAHCFTSQIEGTGPGPTDCNHKRSGCARPRADGYRTTPSRNKRETVLPGQPRRES